jgi:hypothetical protein
MAAITTRQTAGTGATVAGVPLTNTQVDTNFININTELVAAVSTTGSYSNPAWITALDEAKVLPAQTGQSGKVLVTNGTATSWGTVSGGITYTRITTNTTLTDKQGVVADTTGGTFTVTLPASPATGAQVAIADGANWGTNSLTVARNGSTIEDYAEDLVLDITGALVNFIYDGTTWEVYTQVGGAGGGTLNVSTGGTGLATISANGVLLGNGTSPIQTVSPGTTGNILTSNGTTWQSVAPSMSVSTGGTGLTTISANGVLLGNGTSPIQTVSPGTTGNILASNGTTWQSVAPSMSTGKAIAMAIVFGG